MGTSTIFQRFNDFGGRLTSMAKEQLAEIDAALPWDEENHLPGSWRIPLELHNGNVYILVFWHGRLMRLADAPKNLSRKYYDKYRGKTMNAYEWTLLKRYCEAQLKELDKEFRKSLRKEKG